MGFNEDYLDDLGIKITRINAKLFTNIIKISNKEIPISTDDAMKMKFPIVIMGGTTPGHSTDYVGAELASKVNADRFIIATNVNGVYDKDPNKYHKAKHIKEITINELIKKFGTDWTSAGNNVVIDAPCLKLIKKNKITTFILNGKKLDQLEKAIINKNFIGTIIKI